MSEEKNRSKDLVLAPNEFSFLMDQTKGIVDVFCGPFKTSLANTDDPVVFDVVTKRFKSSDLESSKQTEIIAPEGYYIVLKNPAKDNKHPTGGTRATSPDLIIGRKINIPGPEAFCLYPGQMAKVLEGHHICSNQYLVVRVYDEKEAHLNLENAVMKTTPSEVDPTLPVVELVTMGKQFIIKGTEVSFYIPPTGMEVVPDEDGNMVREAVTLETLDYCLLKDENGTKRYVKGPDVVFPNPTEVFSEKEIENEFGSEKTRKFRAIELNTKSGIYVKVTADYEDGGKQYKVGDELFITGKDQMIYFPREEHAIIKYGEREINHGVAIPGGEARYLMNRDTGEISLVHGPTVCLPDPRSEVIVRRILDANLVKHLYPNNQAAIEFNAKLLGVDVDTYLGTSAISVAASPALMYNDSMRYTSDEGGTVMLNDHRIIGAARRRMSAPSAKGFAGDDFNRKGQYIGPRTLTLNSKYEGAVSTDVWTGYAIKLVRKTGESKIVLGPKTVIMEYDETPQIMSLSSGKPKTTDNMFKTAFLRVTANKVSDMMEVETKDFLKVNIKLSYRVNFEGDSSKWFDVENYVKFLCDHMRSRITNAVRRFTIEEFYTDAISTLRDIILGKSVDGNRSGTVFKENGMRIYDVEVLKVEMENKEVQQMFIAAQRETISQNLRLASEKRKLDFARNSEQIKQATAEVEAETAKQMAVLREQEVERKLILDLAQIEADSKKDSERLKKQLETQTQANQVEEKKLEVRKVLAEFDQGLIEAIQQQKIQMVKTEVQAVVDKATAVSPDLIAALQAFGDKHLTERVAESMAPLSILGGGKKSVHELLGEMLRGTKLADYLLAPSTGVANGNGSIKSTTPTA